MKIAYFITGLKLGGAEMVTLDIARQMAGRGHKVMVVSLTGENAHKVDPAVRVVELGMRKTPAGLLRALHKGRRVVREFDPDVVHGNMIHANIFARMLRVFTPVPRLVCTEHSKDIRGRGRMLAYRFTDFLSDVNTNVSREATEHFINERAFGKSKSLAVCNGIDMKRFAPSDAARKRIRGQYGIGKEEFLWINVGRLTEAKDHANLIRALAQTPGGKLIVVGQGELREQLESEAAEVGVAHRVIFAGAHRNIFDYYNAADGFAQSSAWEGMPLAIIEAAACSLPVVFTDTGGAMEILSDSRWMVPSRDPRALAAGMRRMMDMPVEQRNALGESNRRKALRFDIGVICDTWERIYRKET